MADVTQGQSSPRVYPQYYTYTHNIHNIKLPSGKVCRKHKRTCGSHLGFIPKIPHYIYVSLPKFVLKPEVRSTLVSKTSKRNFQPVLWVWEEWVLIYLLYILIPDTFLTLDNHFLFQTWKQTTHSKSW